MSKTRVAVLGLGIMGSGMAGQLLQAGHEVTVWNRSAKRAESLAEAGAQVAATPAQAAEGADFVIAMLADDHGSRAVWTGPVGALAAMNGKVAIESSTLTVGWIRELAQAAQAHGVGFLDAPVTGSKQQAQEGKLQFLVGGDAATLDRARDLFDAMGTGLIHLGPTGSGATLKLVNNFLCGVQVASLAQAIAMLERSGMDVKQAVEVLGSGAPGSPLVKTLARRMLDRTYDPPNFLVPLMAKDLAYAEAEFGAAGIPLPSAAAARALFDAAVEGGFADRDIAAIVEPLRA